MDRRSFLRGAALVGSGVAAGGALAGCSSSRPRTSGASGRSPSSTAKTGGGSVPPDWTVLARSLRGTLLEPGTSGYAAAGHLYNSVYTPNPAAIAQCSTASDVQRCIAFAREHNVEIAAHSGGHSYGGYSSCPGLVIDVSALSAISVGGAATGQVGSAGQGIATVGAGARLINVYGQLAADGFLLPGGSCPSVGIAGLALGGGIGVFSRAYGLTCDQTATVEIVTADGVLRRCGPGQHEDLYWASRGAAAEISVSSPRSGSRSIPFRGRSPSSRSSGPGKQPTASSTPGSDGSRPRPTNCGPTASCSAAALSEAA